MNQNQAITIDLVEVMKVEMKNSPKVLYKLAGEESGCIFRVPQSLQEINKEVHHPRIVSIGPYHHGQDLQMIQELKWRYLNDFLKEMPERTTDESLKSLLDRIVLIENEIRQSYSESIEHISSNDVAKMMVLDGVFLIELFQKFGNINHEHQNDPIFKIIWVLPFLMRDFLRIENQIPFFVLQELFNGSQTKTDNPTLPSLILKFFNYAADRPKKVLREYVNLEGKHLLDFFRNSFLGNGTNQDACLERKHFFWKKHVKRTVVVDRDDCLVRKHSKMLHKKTVASIGGNETPGLVVDWSRSTDQELSEDACLEGEGSLNFLQETSDDTHIQPAKKHLKETLTGNETPDDTSIQPAKMHLKQEVLLTEIETSDDDNYIVGTALMGNRTPDNPSSEHIQPVTNEKFDNPSVERIQPATKLVVAGVKLKKNHKAESFLDIKFQNGVLWIPEINLDDFYTCFILNGMIFEQCYTNCSKDITTYIVFLGCLINTWMDVRLLSESKIIQNYLGTDKELVKFFNDIGKYVAFNIKDNYLKNVFKEINEYCDSGWHVGWAEFKHTYFDSPWIFISAFAAFVLLCLTVLQTFYTIYPYYYERN